MSTTTAAETGLTLLGDIIPPSNNNHNNNRKMIDNSNSLLGNRTTATDTDFFKMGTTTNTTTVHTPIALGGVTPGLPGHNNNRIHSPPRVGSIRKSNNMNKTPPQSPLVKRPSLSIPPKELLTSPIDSREIAATPHLSPLSPFSSNIHPSSSHNELSALSERVAPVTSRNPLAAPKFTSRRQSLSGIDSGTYHTRVAPKIVRESSSNGLTQSLHPRSRSGSVTDPMLNDFSSGGTAPGVGRHESNNHLLGFDPLLGFGNRDDDSDEDEFAQDLAAFRSLSTASSTQADANKTTKPTTAATEDPEQCKTPTRDSIRDKSSRGSKSKDKNKSKDKKKDSNKEKDKSKKEANQTSTQQAPPIPSEQTSTATADQQQTTIFTKEDEDENFRLSELRKIAKEFGTPQREEVKPETKKRGMRRSKKQQQQQQSQALTPKRGSNTPSSLMAVQTPATPKSPNRSFWPRRKSTQNRNSSKSPGSDILSEVQIQNIATGRDLLDDPVTDLLDQPSNNTTTAADPFLSASFQPEGSSSQLLQPQQQLLQQEPPPQKQQQQQQQQQPQQQQQQSQQASIPLSPFEQSSLPTSPMIQDLYQVMSQQEAGQPHSLTIPSLAKPSPTSFLTGTEVIRSSEADPSLFQLEIPELSEFIVNSRLCQFLDQYRKEDMNMDLDASLVGVPRMQLQAFITQGIVPPSSAPLVDNHKPVVECLLECADDVTLATYFQQTDSKGVDDRREVAIFERQRQFIVAFRGTTAQQQGKIFKNKKTSTVTVPLDMREPSIQVFSCLKDTYMDLEPQLFQRLDRINEENPFCEMVFTGASVGGAMATLAAYRYSLVRSMVRVQCQVFGCPRVGTREFRSSVNSLPNLKVMRVEYANDSRCAAPSSADGCHVGHSLIVNGKSTAVSAYKFDDGGNFNKHQKSTSYKIGFKKDRDVGAYVTAMEEIEKRRIPWIEDFVGEGVGDGVVGKNSEKRLMV